MYNNVGNGIFKAASSSSVYNSQEYVVASLSHMLLKLEGHKVLSVHHKGVAGEVSLLPRQFADFVAFSEKGGKIFLDVVQYDSSLHFTDHAFSQEDERTRTVFHELWCEKHGDNSLADSKRYKESLELAAWQKKTLESIFGKYFAVRYKRVSHCVFHNEYAFNGKKYDSPYEAARAGGRLFPELNYIEMPFPKMLTLDSLMSNFREKRASEPAFRSGFVVLSGTLPQRDFNKRMGFVFAKRQLRESDLTETFHAELRRRIALEHPTADTESIAREYVKYILSEPRLVPSNSLKNTTVTLAYLDFLLKLGLKVDRIDHVLLFAARSARSERRHAFRKFVVKRSLQREELTRRIASLKGKTDSDSKKELVRSKVFSGLIK